MQIQLPIIVPTIKATPLKSPTRLWRWTASFSFALDLSNDFRNRPVPGESVSVASGASDTTVPFECALPSCLHFDASSIRTLHSEMYKKRKCVK